MRLLPRFGRRRSTAATPAADPNAVERALTAVDARVTRGVPPEFAAAVRNITGRIRELLTRVEVQPAGSEDVYVLRRMATDYLPATLDAYLRLPADQQMRPQGPEGRSPYEVAASQVALLDRTLLDIESAMVKGDHDELSVHGRFLEERFGTGSLSLRSRQ